MTTKTNRFLTIVIIIQALTIASQWLSTGNVSSAGAQVPDAGGQRVQMIEELRGVNAKLDHLTTLLESGKLQVRMNGGGGADDKR